MNSPSYVEGCAELYRRKNFKIQANTPWGIHEKQLHALKLLNDPEVTQIGYGGSGRCFIAGTLVNTSNGHVPIELIKVGDFVLSENPFGEMEYNPVLEVFHNSPKKRKMIRFVMDGFEIKCTEHHEFKLNGQYVSASQIATKSMAITWLMVSEWKKGNRKDFFCKTKGTIKYEGTDPREIRLDEIKEIHFTTENIETYDLCVSDNHNYVITKENIKVHNSGKSWVAGEWLTMNCIAYPGTGWGLARRELKNLKRTTLLTFFKVFHKYKLEFKKDYSYNQQDSVINFKNGSQIFLIDMAYSPQDPHYSEFGGFELTGAVIDESNESPYKAIEILSGRCGFRLNTKYNLPPRTLEMFNPDKGHVYTRFYLPYKEGRETVKSKFIKALPTDNPDPAVKIWIKNQMELASEITIQRLIHGDFEYDESKDRLIESDAINDYFTNAHVLEGTGYITADIARMGRDSTMIRVWKGLRVIERVEIFKSKITETAAAIKLLSVKYSIPMSRTIVDEDGVGGGCRDILNCHGFVANSKPIGITNYSNLKAQCTFLMAKLINERKVYEPLNNTGLMTRIRQEMDWVRELGIDSDGKRRVIPKIEVKEAIRRSPDDWDSIMMRAYFELGTRI